MSTPFDDRVRQSRKLLENPYAYLDGDGGYAVVEAAAEPSNVHEARRILENQYAYLDEHGGYSEWRRPINSTGSRPLVAPIALLAGRPKDKDFSKKEIEGIARRLHVELWNRRKDIWPTQNDISPAEILDPSTALISIGYAVHVAESLGQYSGDGELFEVAGLIDNSKSEVQVSRRFSPDIRRFTIAHELGHAILHSSSGLHRDRALDGAGAAREPREAEADLFASYFLLPEKPLREAFERMFLTQRFVLTEETAFALTSKSLDVLQRRCRTARDLARILASAEYYNGVHFDSLARRFGVSTEAMAIRLEELGLIES
jgi:Zn-dependent peptidase ImmA (M78 family)